MEELLMKILLIFNKFTLIQISFQEIWMFAKLKKRRRRFHPREWSYM